MKELKKVWEKFLIEGEVIQGPWDQNSDSSEDSENTRLLVSIENELASALEKRHDGTDQVSIQKLE